MVISKLISLGLVLLPFVNAVVHDVDVGKDGLTFTPEAIVRFL